MYKVDGFLLLKNISMLTVFILMIMMIILHKLTKNGIYKELMINSIINLILLIHFNWNDYAQVCLSINAIFTFNFLFIIINRLASEIGKKIKITVLFFCMTAIVVSTYNVNISIYMYIIFNSFLIRDLVNNKIYKRKKEVAYNRSKIKENKRNIDLINDKIKDEFLRTKKLKDKEEIFNLTYKICILNMKNLVLVLDNLNKITDSNKSFNETFKKHNYINLETFLKSNFYNYKNILKFIDKNKNDICIQGTVESFDKNFYDMFIIRLKFDNQDKKIFVLKNTTEINTYTEKINCKEMRYRKLMDIIEDGVIISKRERVIYINSRISDIFDIKDIVKTVYEFSDYIQDGYKNDFVNNIVSNESDQVEKSWVIKTKDNKDLRVYSTNINDDEETTVTFISDVTKTKKIIRSIEEKEKEYRLLLQMLPEGIIIIQKDNFQNIYKNKQMIKIYKRIGIEKLDEIIKDYIDCNMFNTNKIIDLENDTHNISITISDIKDEKIYIAIVKLIKKENYIDNNTNNYEINNKERLHNEISKSMVNELKTPTEFLISRNELMEKINEDDNLVIQNHVNLSKRNLYRLKKISDNLVDILNIEKEIYRLDYKVFDLVTLIKNVIDLSSRYIENRNLNINLITDKKQVLVELDELKMQKIIIHIISNAIKFTRYGGNIEISIEEKLDFAVVKIADDGIGIPKNKIDCIFENFGQVDKSLSRMAEGMGLGLYLVKKLAEIQDIYIDVDSEIGIGTEFKILIKNKYIKNIEKKYTQNSVIDKKIVEIEYSDIYV